MPFSAISLFNNFLNIWAPKKLQKFPTLHHSINEHEKKQLGQLLSYQVGSIAPPPTNVEDYFVYFYPGAVCGTGDITTN